MSQRGFHIEVRDVENIIHDIRGRRVILDKDLANIYGVETRRLNEQVRRNKGRFPEDFCFQLTPQEWTDVQVLRSQNAMLNKGRGKHRKYLPYVFTEHGAIMAANVLNSSRAIQMSVFVVRAFVKMRETLMMSKTLAEKLPELEKKLTNRLDMHEQAIVQIMREIKKLMVPLPAVAPKRRRIGFQIQRTG